MLCQISTINMLYVIQLGPRLARVGERITRVELVEVGGGKAGQETVPVHYGVIY